MQSSLNLCERGFTGVVVRIRPVFRSQYLPQRQAPGAGFVVSRVWQTLSRVSQQTVLCEGPFL